MSNRDEFDKLIKSDLSLYFLTMLPRIRNLAIKIVENNLKVLFITDCEEEMKKLEEILESSQAIRRGNLYYIYFQRSFAPSPGVGAKELSDKIAKEMEYKKRNVVEFLPMPETQNMGGFMVISGFLSFDESLLVKENIKEKLDNLHI